MNRRHEVIAIAITLLIAAIIGVASIVVFTEYGMLLFIFVPILIGFLPPYIVGRQQKVTRNRSYVLSFSTLGMSLFCVLIFALDGLICIMMALPILALLTLLGSYIGYIAQKGQKVNPTNTTLLLLIGGIGFMSFDYVNEPKGLIPIRTKVLVDAAIEDVWENVVTFSEIPEPTDWLFETGIAYPTDATIQGTGVGAIRYCNFTTGQFVEPITTWDEPNLLQFDVKEQPTPMKEINPFWEVHPAHLEGYFKSYKGQFQLTSLDNGITELEGTTWYQVDLAPAFYWKFWSSFIVHRIHKRVLNHIKQESESVGLGLNENIPAE